MTPGRSSENAANHSSATPGPRAETLHMPVKNSLSIAPGAEARELRLYPRSNLYFPALHSLSETTLKTVLFPIPCGSKSKGRQRTAAPCALLLSRPFLFNASPRNGTRQRKNRCSATLWVPASEDDFASQLIVTGLSDWDTRWIAWKTAVRHLKNRNSKSMIVCSVMSRRPSWTAWNWPDVLKSIPPGASGNARYSSECPWPGRSRGDLRNAEFDYYLAKPVALKALRDAMVRVTKKLDARNRTVFQA